MKVYSIYFAAKAAILLTAYAYATATATPMTVPLAGLGLASLALSGLCAFATRFEMFRGC